jgi:glucose-1-phosphate cytidylyltransferase
MIAVAEPTTSDSTAAAQPVTTAVLLAGGLGSRLSEETTVRPKPMVEIGGRPILWHIMKILWTQGIKEFIVCLGYRGYMIKEYFANYTLHRSDVTIDNGSREIMYHQLSAEPWRVTLVDTGPETMTGGRLKRIGKYLKPDAPFLMTYGDGLADINVRALTAFHSDHGLEATITAVVPPGRYGALDLEADRVLRFVEKPPGDNALINGGFFILHPRTLARIKDDQTPFEREPLESLARDRQLAAYRHTGFWHAMDTLRDKLVLEDLWASDNAPWRLWADD